jgi:hypothetical protein
MRFLPKRGGLLASPTGSFARQTPVMPSNLLEMNAANLIDECRFSGSDLPFFLVFSRFEYLFPHAKK